ncbi:MAG: antitoxin VapB family protein [Candidatus Hydrothermarchaeota archaeon]|nr:antitoxin VapB family protein [Candidatus Hydrothermarchaeota archaeon]
MASKTISVTEDVYRLLSRMKLKSESFSEMLVRLAKKKGSLSECAGLWRDMSEEEIEELKEGIKEMRKSLTSSVEEGGVS